MWNKNGGDDLRFTMNCKVSATGRKKLKPPHTEALLMKNSSLFSAKKLALLQNQQNFGAAAGI